MTAEPPVLNVDGVSSGYGQSIVVRNVNLDVRPGEIVALLGKNGMGKSTVLKTIMGFLPAQEGHISLMGRDVTAEPPHRMARLGVAYAPQDKSIFQDLTVRENLVLGLPDPRAFDAEFKRIRGIFPFMAERLNQYSGTLSGGEQKMLILARALMAGSTLILLDEITEGLQPSVIDRLAQALLEERERTGVSIFLVEQHIQFALRVADRWAVLKLGEIEDAGASSANDAASRIANHLAL
jgi:ABC-type branched-subunit amino acid transport system ATPase component